MRYKIKLQEMEFRAYHGCYDLEQKVGNRFAVNIELTTTLENPLADDVTQAVNYLEVYAITRRVMQQTQRTIEVVALNIIAAIKEAYPAVELVVCEVAKLAPPLGGKLNRVSVVVEG